MIVRTKEKLRKKCRSEVKQVGRRRRTKSKQGKQKKYVSIVNGRHKDSP